MMTPLTPLRKSDTIARAELSYTRDCVADDENAQSKTYLWATSSHVEMWWASDESVDVSRGARATHTEIRRVGKDIVSVIVESDADGGARAVRTA
jgi:hypothetical protein